MPKLVLVNPTQPGPLNLRADPRANMPPLGLAYVAAYTPAHCARHSTSQKALLTN